MALATASLPSDPAALRALAIALQAALATKDRELAARDAEIYAKTLHIEKLRATLALMKRARFGRSSERIEPAANAGRSQQTPETQAPVVSSTICRLSSAIHARR
jgi:hypothetical protein